MQLKVANKHSKLQIMTSNGKRMQILKNQIDENLESKHIGTGSNACQIGVLVQRVFVTNGHNAALGVLETMT